MSTLMVTRLDDGNWYVITGDGVEEFAHGGHSADELLPAVERVHLGGWAATWHPADDGGFWTDDPR